MAKNKMVILRGAFETGAGGILHTWASGSAVDYVVPASRELIIKNIRLVNTGATDYNVAIKIGVSGGTLHTIFPTKDIPAYDGFSEDCHIGLLAGQSVSAIGENTALEYVLTCLERDA